MKKITFIILVLIGHLGISQNIVINGEFNSGLDSWTTFAAGFTGVSASFSAANNEGNITNISGAGGMVWHVQLNQILTAGQISSLQVGESYKISFSARSNVNNRQLRLFFGQEGGSFTAVKIEDYQITTNMESYESIFVVGQTFGSMKLGFEMGLSNDDVFIDNVVLELNVVDPVTDATLSALEVDGMSVPGFDPQTFDYTFDLQIGTVDVPQITAATTSNPNATTVVTQATSIPGDATVVVTSEDESVTETYTITFVESFPNAAPTPTTPNAEVLMLFGDTGGYTNNWMSDYTFGERTVVNLGSGGNVNQAIKMDFSIAGWGAGTNTTTNISTYGWVHFDYYADSSFPAGANGHQVLFILIDNDGAVQEFNYELRPTGGDGVLVFDSWQGVDIPLSFFVNKGFDINNFFQYKLGTSSDLNTRIVYFDNIFFSQNQALNLNDVSLTDFRVFPNPSNLEWNVVSNSTIKSISLVNVLGKQVLKLEPNNSTYAIDNASLATGLYFATIATENGSSVVKLIKN